MFRAATVQEAIQIGEENHLAALMITTHSFEFLGAFRQLGLTGARQLWHTPGFRALLDIDVAGFDPLADHEAESPEAALLKFLEDVDEKAQQEEPRTCPSTPIVTPIIREPLPPFVVEHKNGGNTIHIRLRPTSVDLGSYQLSVKTEENLTFHFSREAEMQLMTDQQLFRMVADHIGKAGLTLVKMQSVGAGNTMGIGEARMRCDFSIKTDGTYWVAHLKIIQKITTSNSTPLYPHPRRG
jgi:hypothetical protein